MSGPPRAILPTMPTNEASPKPLAAPRERPARSTFGRPRTSFRAAAALPASGMRLALSRASKPSRSRLPPTRRASRIRLPATVALRLLVEASKLKRRRATDFLPETSLSPPKCAKVSVSASASKVPAATGRVRLRPFRLAGGSGLIEAPSPRRDFSSPGESWSRVSPPVTWMPAPEAAGAQASATKSTITPAKPRYIVLPLAVGH